MIHKQLPPNKQKGLLIDTVECKGCMSCYLACKEINGLPNNDDKELNQDTFTVIKREKGYNVRKLCMHCVSPACVSVCPVGAMQKTPEGPVTYDAYKCIGCRYCMMACPFNVPTYEWHGMTPRVRKCFMCYDKRVSKGKPTACAESCPYGATVFGTKEQLLKIARKRIMLRPKKYEKQIFGEHELGGTGTMYLAGVPFKEFGFRDDFENQPLPALTWNVLSRLPDIIVMGAIMMSGVVWIINRRMEQARTGDSEDAHGAGH